ncbi:MAG: quinoprotein dehydrogenase-associated putative ABC transporter substrate-binding protein [Alphaproteobacteria bacterium GM202ARS2]|nr:quinoprotein dehydrogenase-associated putative ABC transporter substrate-binding protein [Alphaproteobacteria bacterium GM202ARS2]
MLMTEGQRLQRAHQGVMRAQATARHRTGERVMRLLFVVAVSYCLVFASSSAWARGITIDAVDLETLRVCADPSNLPFSNDKGEGFENEIAQLLADWLERDLVYEWFPQAIGFVRNTLSKKKCDVIIGITSGDAEVLNTNPYYRWGHVMAYLDDSGIVVDRPDHPQLAELRIGAVAGTPTNHVLHRYNLMSRVRPYNLIFDTRKQSIGRDMIKDLENGLTDIVYMAAPIAAYHAKQEGLKLVTIPLETTDQGHGKLDFLMTMGVRAGENDWKRTLNRFLRAKKDDIQAILKKHGVPTLPLRPKRRGR